MHPLTFIIRSLWYFRRRHLAVFAGTLISAAVLTGALVVGDSVKYSLRQIVEARLGNTAFALQTGDRYVDVALAERIGAELDTRSAPLLMMQGVARNPAGGSELNRVQVIGIDKEFGELTGKNIPLPRKGEALISTNTAERLNVSAGDFILIRVNESSPIPVNAPFAAETSTVALRLKIAAVLGAEEMGRFSLQSIQSAPFNVFVSMKELSAKLNLENRVNTILLSGNDLDKKKVKQTFARSWKLTDAGLQIRRLDQGFIELTTDRIFIDPPVIKAIENLNLPDKKILTYLVNDLGYNGRHTPYSFVSAATPPLIPADLEINETIINQWLADDLGAAAGDTLTFTYYVIGPLRRLDETSRKFVIREVIPVQDYLTGGSLMPDFPGLADAGSCSEWNSSVPIDLDRIRDKDETYWDDHRGTPKALINISAGTEMWGNEFGNFTAIRFSTEDIPAENLQQKLSDALSPSDFGLAFRPVKEEGYYAVEHAVDFAGLFLSLSFFVIAAAVLLTALLFGLAAESRRQEAGILAAVGFRKPSILKIQLTEALLVALLGSVAGAFAGLLYNQLILSALNSVWQDVVRTQMLSVHVNPLSLFTGATISVLIAASIMFFVIRKKLKQPLALLVKGATAEKGAAKKRRKYVPAGMGIFSLLTGGLLVVYSLFLSDGLNS
ncbi:MAG: FtsX-like permease family protein, partial [Bacteroidales bacterium]